jgi:Domain of unknown function (DUF3336)
MRISHTDLTRILSGKGMMLIFIELGNDLWRQNPVDKRYDYKLIHSRLQTLVEAQENGDVQGLMYIIRSGASFNDLLTSGLLRNLGNITAKKLYNHGYAGYILFSSFLIVVQSF